jgi:hypothetical protein
MKNITEINSLQNKAQNTQEEGHSLLLIFPYEEKRSPYVDK